MPFVKRNADGGITAVFHERTEDTLEEVPADNIELAAFLADEGLPDMPRAEWLESDLGLARVLEDLIDVLIDKNVITFTDLPAEAQNKLLKRRGLRSSFSYVETLFSEEDDLAADGGRDDGEGYL